MTADLVAALVALFRDDTEISALAGDRVFGNELPRSAIAKMPQAAIVIVPSGGISISGDTFAEHDSQRFDIRSYGSTQFEADSLRREIYRLLRRLPRTISEGVLIHSCSTAGGYTSLRDSDGDWPVFMQSFQILYGLELI